VVALKRERIRESILALNSLLRLICKSPEAYRLDTTLASALVSQGALASLSYCYLLDGEEKRILPLSLNTVKRQADVLIDQGGYKTLDKRRVEALKAITRQDIHEAQPSKRTKVGLLAAVDSLEELVNSHRRSNFRILQGLNRSVDAIKTIRDCEDRELRKKRAADAIKDILAILSINESPFDVLLSSSVVTPIRLPKS